MIPALSGISLHIAEGEYVALVGANGSGKSTLARLLNALLLPDRGTVKIANLDTRVQKNHAHIRRTVGMVFQRPEDQMIASTIEDDVAFGPENLAVPPEDIRARVRYALEMVDLWSIRHRRPDQVSAGQMQRIALAGVLAMHPRCIIFDEATAMLDPAGRKTVRTFMQQLHREGLTIITITHFMDEVLDATRMVVLDQGHVLMEGPPREVFGARERVREAGLDIPPVTKLAVALRNAGVPIDRAIYTVNELVTAIEKLGKPDVIKPRESLEGDQLEPVLKVRDLAHTYNPGTPAAHQALRHINLTIHKQIAHGLMGATGAGKSTLLQHFNALLRPQQGDIWVEGQWLSHPDTDIIALRRKVGLVFQLPEAQIFEQYVGDEIAYGPRLAGLEGTALRERVRWAMALVGLDFMATKDRPTFALSGGEKRKVALASSLALRPSILLLDEPTAGLDPVSHEALLQKLEVLATQMTLVLSSHQMGDLAALTRELSVMASGEIVYTGSTGSVFSKVPQLLDLGLDVPVVTQVTCALRERGWSLPGDLIRDEDFVTLLRRGYG